MTSNQRRAVRLAEEIDHVPAPEPALADADWHLLLLAAGVNQVHARPQAVAERVLDQCRQHVGYFAPTPRAGGWTRSRCEASRRPPVVAETRTDRKHDVASIP